MALDVQAKRDLHATLDALDMAKYDAPVGA